MATLKISELSVGDWVSFDTAYLTVEGYDIATAFVKKVQQPARIKSILGDQDLIFAEVEPEDNFGTIYLKMEHIRPIPITAEILEKNGFKRSSSYWVIYKDNDDYIEIWENRDKWYLSVYSVEYTLCDLHWVHQIQHLMRVWGFDKEINL